MASRYTVGDIEIRPDERRVLVAGMPAALGARAFDLLMCLIEQRDRVVTKNELMARVWPGSVVEEGNLTVHISALRKLLGAQALATVPGRGYRFAQEVCESVTGPPGASAPASGESELPLPDRPSIAVLAFENLSGDPAQDCFIDGVVEDIITELSRFRSLFVIARNSTFTYKGRAVDVRTIARELGVRYVVEGSIRRAADRIRVAAQLIDAPTRAQLWAEKYDRAVEDIFAVQGDLTQAIVAAVAPQVESVETQKLHRADPGSLGAYELAMRARDVARRADREADAPSRDEALRLAHVAVALDPDCGAALRTIAYVHWQQVWAADAASDTGAVQEGLDAARRAISIDKRRPPRPSLEGHAAAVLRALRGRLDGPATCARVEPERRLDAEPARAVHGGVGRPGDGHPACRRCAAPEPARRAALVVPQLPVLGPLLGL